MSLEIIRNDSKELTSGESSLLNKIRSLYKDYEKEAYLYIQPNLGKLIPDFIIIDEDRGLSILEVKDWSAEYIRSMNKRTVELQDRSDDNPVYKTKKYLDIARGIVSSSDYDLSFIEDDIYANTVLTNISTDISKETNIDKFLKQDPINCITSDLMRGLTIDDLFSNYRISMSQEELINIRISLFPEIKIVKNTKNSTGAIVSTTIKALDVDQENFARRLPYGHYMVSGVPGSGKTVILIARALHLVKENPSWSIQIMTYNKSLKNKIESILETITEEIKGNIFFSDMNVHNISVDTFHKVALEVANISVPRPPKQGWWDETLPSVALDRATPRYDAILIDEYQDFRDDWIRTCIKLCKKHEYIDNSNEQATGINLFLAGDRLQSIYNSKPHNWNKDFNISMAGRSKLLKTSYRAGRESISLALSFLQQHEGLEKEVNRFYKDEEESSITINDKEELGSVSFLEGPLITVVNTVSSLLNEGYKYNDFLIICHSKNDCDKISKQLPQEIGYNARFVKSANNKEMETCLLMSTYYSSKGLEAKVVILVDTQKFTEQIVESKNTISRKLLYVGMTRSSERLFIHASNYNENSLAKVIRDIYKG